ncbi:unnamed protein product [Rhodiola kirilowii]
MSPRTRSGLFMNEASSEPIKTGVRQCLPIPRTYDLIHADSIFSLYNGRCEMDDIYWRWTES